jgi:hypothetical protein
MRPAFVGVILATLIGLTLVFWSFTLKPAPAPVAIQAKVEPSAAPEAAPVTQIVAEPQPIVEVPRPVRIDPEVERTKAIERAIDERYLESSPAKDTPEARQIEEMLARRGIGRVEMPLAYNITWNYHHFLKVTKHPVAARVEVDRLMKRLSSKGPIGEDFWNELFAIKPTVFYGQKDFSLPPEFASN